MKDKKIVVIERFLARHAEWLFKQGIDNWAISGGYDYDYPAILFATEEDAEVFKKGWLA